MSVTDTNGTSHDLGSEILDVLLVGAGFAGLFLLRSLRGAGFKVKVVDSAAGLGGIWHWNCYPGARVDTDAPMYEFSAAELWKDWTWCDRFPSGPELRQYFEHVDRVWDLSRDVMLNTRVTAARFEENGRYWNVTTNQASSIRARFVVLCTGFASKPYIPSIPGLEDFQGTCVHTAQWPQGGLDLRGKNVSVIGTGASGVQVTQEASKVAKSVTVFQRTPILALPMQQKRLDDAGQKKAKEEYEQRYARRRETFAGLDFDFIHQGALEVSDAKRNEIYEDLWAKGGFNFWLGTFHDVLMELKANRTAYDFWRDKTRARIKDPVLKERLAPSEPPHPFGVKRPSLEQHYFEAFNLDHVHLVDVREAPIERAGPLGLTAGGKLHKADVIVMATGFDAVTGGLTAIDIQGATGQTLRQHWSDGVRTYLGVACNGFPNLIMSYGPQSPSGFVNGPTSAEIQGEWIANLLKELRAKGLTRIEPTRSSEVEWNEIVETLTAGTLFPLADSWYMGANIPGKKRQLLNFPGGMPDYIRRCNEALANNFSGFTVQ